MTCWTYLDKEYLVVLLFHSSISIIILPVWLRQFFHKERKPCQVPTCLGRKTFSRNAAQNWLAKIDLKIVAESDMSGFITSFDTASRYAVFHQSGCLAESGKFVMGRAIPLPKSVGMMAKNLQVVSFDADWTEIYLGTVRAGKI